jgi:hypothetical protein
MKRQPKEKRDTEVRFWTRDEARKAVPYIRSVLRTLREHWLEMQAQDRDARRLADRPGRLDRAALIAHAEAVRRRDEARGRFLDSIDELEDIDVYCAEPTRGEAVIPTLNADQPAWLIFDLFADEPLTHWRYHSDPIETYRPMQELWDQVSTIA